MLLIFRARACCPRSAARTSGAFCPPSCCTCVLPCNCLYTVCLHSRTSSDKVLKFLQLLVDINLLNFDREVGGRQIFVTRVSHEIDVLLCTWYLSVLNVRLLTCQLSDTHHVNYLVALPNTLRVCSTLILVYQSPPVDMRNLLFHITLTSICSDKSLATSLFPILRTT